MNFINIKIFVASIFFLLIRHEEKQVAVLFQNESKEEMKELKVRIVGHEFIFNNVKPGQKTKQVFVPKSYRYCYAQAITSRDTLYFIPIDYTGERLYTNGSLLIRFYIEDNQTERSLEIKYE